MEKLDHPVAENPRYRAFMCFAYALRYLDLISTREGVRLTGGVFKAVEES